MKCCHLTSVHDRYDNRIFYRECSSLANAGFDVTLIAPGKNDEVKNGVKIQAVKRSASRTGRMIKTVNEVYRKAMEVNADVYHFHDPELIRVGLALKRRRKKVIYDVHEDVPRQLLAKYYLPKFSRQMIASQFEKYENEAVKKFDQVITVTPLLEKRFLLLNRNTIQVCNFPSPEEFDTPETSWADRKNEICYIGSITRIRGIHEMVSALGKTNTQLHLAGTFSPHSLQNEISKVEGWEKVREHGQLSREKIYQLLRSVKAGLVLLHPVLNYKEAYPIKMFEYMAAGLPVIASDFPLWREIIETNQCGICVNPLDVNAIENAISFILAHDSEAEKMGLNGKTAVRERYTWKREEEKLISTYLRIQEQQ